MANKFNKSFIILLAEDDPDDVVLIRDAFNENRFECKFLSVNDGEELLDYLYVRGKFYDPSLCPKPDLILLDLNMPKKDGREALAEIKSDFMLKTLPIVVLTTSNSEVDVIRSYNLGANSYITKPMSYGDLIKVIGIMVKYWFQTVKLPPMEANHEHQNE